MALRQIFRQVNPNVTASTTNMIWYQDRNVILHQGMGYCKTSLDHLVTLSTSQSSCILMFALLGTSHHQLLPLNILLYLISG